MPITPVGSRCGPAGDAVSSVPFPRNKGQNTKGAGNFSRRLGIYGEDDLNDDNIRSSTMRSVPSMTY